MNVISAEWESDNFLFSTDKSRLDRELIYRYLAGESYWAQGIPTTVVDAAIDNSLSFGVFDHGRQVGFARIVTDYATFGYLADVFIVESYRGRGLAKKLMQFIFGLEAVNSWRRILLGTRDAHGLYRKVGFKEMMYPERFMEIHRPDIYTKTKS